MNSWYKPVLLMLVLVMCVQVNGFASAVCEAPCWEPNDPTLQGSEPCVKVPYSKDITEKPQAWSESYASEVIVMAVNFAMNYFASGQIKPEKKWRYRFNYLECCEIGTDYKLGEKKVSSVNPVVSGSIEWAASSKTINLIPELANQIASGWAGVYPDGLIAQIKDSIESWIPTVDFGKFTGVYGENYTEETSKDECKGCPVEETIWVGQQEVQGSAAGALLNMPAYQMGGHGIPSIQVKLLEGKMYWRKWGSMVGTFNKIEKRDRKSLLAYSYKIGDDPLVFEWVVPPVDTYSSGGGFVCDRW